MRFIYCAFIGFCALPFLISCGGSKKSKSKNIMPGTWQATPISIDGDSKDWPSPYPNYDSKAKVAYATSNDRHFLYVTCETGDQITEMKILKAGMIVSIDTSGGKDASFHINYPLQNENSDIEIPHKESNGDKNAALHMEKTLAKSIKKAADDASQFSLEGFPKCTGGFMVAQTIPCGITVKTRIDEYNELVWEAAIPVKALYNKDSLTDAEAGKPISVCFQVKSLKAPKKEPDNSTNSMNSGGSGGGMGGRGGAGRGMGGAPKTKQAESPLANLYVTTKTWKQFRLVTNP